MGYSLLQVFEWSYELFWDMESKADNLNCQSNSKEKQSNNQWNPLTTQVYTEFHLLHMKYVLSYVEKCIIYFHNIFYNWQNEVVLCILHI